MPTNVATARQTTPDKDRVIPRPIPAKATLDDKTGTERLSGVVLDSSKAAYGKQGAAAAKLGKDEGNFSRDAKARRLTIRDLEELGEPFLAELGQQLVKQYGAALESPQDRAARVIREARQKLDELDEYLRFIA